MQQQATSLPVGISVSPQKGSPCVCIFLLKPRLLLLYDGCHYSRLSSGPATRPVPLRAVFRLQLSGFAAPRKSQFKLKPTGDWGKFPVDSLLGTVRPPANSFRPFFNKSIFRPIAEDEEERYYFMKCSMQCLAAFLVVLCFVLAAPHSFAQSTLAPDRESLDVLYSSYQRPLLLATPRSLFPATPQSISVDLPDVP